MTKKKEERKYVIDVYLRTSDRPDEIKSMMKQLFGGRVETLERWGEIDKNVNERRVK